MDTEVKVHLLDMETFEGADREYKLNDIIQEHDIR